MARHHKKTIKRLQKKYQLYYPLLTEFVKATSDQRKVAISRMNNDCIAVLFECCDNALFSDVLQPEEKKNFFDIMKGNICHLCHFACGKMSQVMRREYCLKMRNCLAIMLHVLLPKIKHHI